jgi:8-oxo-dGTP diphosphatase
MNPIIVSTAIILNELNEILVTKEEDKWGLPGGRIEKTESPLETLKRELEEELSINNVNAELLGVFKFEKAFKSDKPLVMNAYIVNTNDKIFPTDDIEEILWLNSTNYSNPNFDFPKFWWDQIFLELKKTHPIAV